ncbi:B12-binding domain-containing radical SAM protein [Kribbella sp. NPDC056345]|uniref:B12-binding domain-containing radical SAM protein n=1 Tax=Kribbella sp. NPDC056345 TaxID=3345789 RepID=UPI0035DBC857
MKTLLVNPPTLHKMQTFEDLNSVAEVVQVPYYQRLVSSDVGTSSRRSTFPGEHLGLQSIEASLSAAGREVELLNACAEMHSTLKQALDAILASAPDVVGFSGPVNVVGENAWFARKLREHGFAGHITIGHDFATLNDELFLRTFDNFDSVVRGEGEQTMVELLDGLELGDLSGVPGLTYRDDRGQIVRNRPRPAIANLDDLAWASRSDTSQVLDCRMSAALWTQRGCAYRCNFCTTGEVPDQLGFRGSDRWRRRSVKSVVDELENLQSRFGVDHVTIVDDLFLAKGETGTSHAREFAEEVLERKLELTFMIDCRVDGIDREVMALLARAGLRKVFVGVESASETALLDLNKHYHPKIIRERLSILDELGVTTAVGFIFLNPTDSLAGLRSSFDLLVDLDLRTPHHFFSSLKVHPGTTLERQLRAAGRLEGTFPFFKAVYTDARVARVARILGEVAALTNVGGTALDAETFYHAFVRWFPTLLEACQDGSGDDREVLGSLLAELGLPSAHLGECAHDA